MIVEENKYRFKLELDVATGIESFPMRTLSFGYKTLRFKREFPCLQAGDDSVSFRLSFGLQYIFLLFLPIYDQRTLQNRILSRGMVNDYATMEIRSAGRRMNIPSTD